MFFQFINLKNLDFCSGHSVDLVCRLACAFYFGNVGRDDAFARFQTAQKVGSWIGQKQATQFKGREVGHAGPNRRLIRFIFKIFKYLYS
jgi:hypothetical protein